MNVGCCGWRTPTDYTSPPVSLWARRMSNNFAANFSPRILQHYFVDCCLTKYGCHLRLVCIDGSKKTTRNGIRKSSAVGGTGCHASWIHDR